MFLSRISLSPEAPNATGFWRLFENPYRLHQEVWALFADRPDRERDFLYRLDRDLGQPRIFCLSQREPRSSGIFRVETKPFAPVLLVGGRLSFVLRANPIVCRGGARHDVVMNAKRELVSRGVVPGERPAVAELAQEHGTAWLVERAGRHGFAVEPAAVRVERYEVVELAKPGGRRVRFATCDFTGHLTVTELPAFLHALQHGIGPAKGFGCGLLLVKRASL